MVVLSVIAIIPVILLKDLIFGFFANYNRIISQGLPILILTMIFGIVGVSLMIITKDSLISTLVSTLKRKVKKSSDEN